MYESLGEGLQQAMKYEKIFSGDADMKRVLSYLYKDVLEFHRRALKYFQQPSMCSFFQLPGNLAYLTQNPPFSVEAAISGNLENVQDSIR